ncbi:MAG: TolC family protein [Acidobacteria bacterium]|nr:TolC family protein [Acidobacteriota bacterium]
MRLLSLLLLALPLLAQEKLTLQQAVATALRSNPRMALDRIAAEMAAESLNESRSAYFPTIIASTTAAGALNESRLAAGALNNPIIFNRYAAGAAVTQLITDFGRTNSLVQASRLRARTHEENIRATQAQLTLAVHRAYFQALRAAGILAIARQAEQAQAAARNGPRPALDAGFAEVNRAEAHLAVLAARSEHDQALADLSLLLGYPRPRRFELEDVTAPGEPPPDAEPLIAAALNERPDLAAIRTERQAALAQVTAERRAALPTVTAFANGGAAPIHDDRLRNRFAAAAINLSVPVFNGGLIATRRRAAELRVQAIDQRLRELENQTARDVTASTLAAQAAFERIGLTASLLRQAALAGELARQRYEQGLASIVELTQAQVNETTARIQATAAGYDYLTQRAQLDFQAGRLR